MAYCAQLQTDFAKFKEDFELVGTHVGRAQNKFVDAQKRLGRFETKLEQAADWDEAAIEALRKQAEKGDWRTDRNVRVRGGGPTAVKEEPKDGNAGCGGRYAARTRPVIAP